MLNFTVPQELFQGESSQLIASHNGDHDSVNAQQYLDLHISATTSAASSDHPTVTRPLDATYEGGSGLPQTSQQDEVDTLFSASPPTYTTH